MQVVAVGVINLYSSQIKLCNVDITVTVAGNAIRIKELARSLAVFTESEEESAGIIKDLYTAVVGVGDIDTAVGGRHRHWFIKLTITEFTVNHTVKDRYTGPPRKYSTKGCGYRRPPGNKEVAIIGKQ